MSLMRPPLPPPYHPPHNRLLVQDGMQVSTKERPLIFDKVIRLLIALCGSIGTLVVMRGFFDFNVDLKPIIAGIIAVTVIMRTARAVSAKAGFFMILSSFAAIPLLLLRYREAAVVGAGAIYHIMRKTILWQNSFPETPPVYAGTWDENKCIWFVFVLVAAALVALLEYSDVLLTHTQSSRSGFWIRFLVTFPFLECGLYFGLETSSIAVFMLIFFWIGSLAIGRKHAPHKVESKQGDFAALQAQFSAQNEKRFGTHEAAAAFMLAAALAIMGGTLFSTSRYVRSEEIDRRRDSIVNWYRSITIEDIAGFFESLPDIFEGNVISDEVDLMKNSDLHFDGRPVLHMEIGGAAAPDDYYMRGVVRSEYTGRGWATPNGFYRRHQRLFRRLTKANRMPQTIFHSDHADELRIADGKFPVVRCRVQALNFENVNYLPYQYVAEAGTKFRYDTESQLENQQEYSYWLLNNAPVNWRMFTENQRPSPDPLIEEYEGMADEQYVKLPNTEAIERIRNLFAPYQSSLSGLPLDQQLNAIRDFIWERAEYTMQPGAQPADQDFVEYFLTQGHRGYCAHYASAAVVLCRICGIPARYCQGYVLTTNDFITGKKDEGYDVYIPDDRAHAWAEIYVKGYGWIPFEFTETVMESWHRPIETTAPVVSEVQPETTTTAVPVPAAETTAPQSQTQPQTTTTAPGAVPENNGGLSPETVSKILHIVLTILGIAAVIVLYWLLHRLITERRDKAMHDKDPNKAALASYEFIVHLLRIYGIEQKQLGHIEYAEMAEEQCTLLPPGRILRAVEIQETAVFSRSGIAAADAKTIRKTAEQLAAEMYRKAKPLRKLWLRWGRHIVK